MLFVFALASLCYGQSLNTQVNIPKVKSPHAALSTKGISNASSPTGPSVSLTCIAPTSGITPDKYNFYRSTTSGSGYVILGSSTTCAYTDSTVNFNTTYYYVATSVNTSTCPSGSVCESADSNQVSAVVGSNPVPNPPTGLTVGQIVAKQVPLQWQAPVAQPEITVNAYSVWRGGNATMPSPSKISTVTNTSYVDGTCKLKVCYYEVKAQDTVGKKGATSGPSNIVKAVL